MVDSALSALSNQLDASFLTACWLPAFVAVLANAGFLALLVGPSALATWATDLDSVEQGLAALLIVVVITLLALLLRALALVIVAGFAGELLPRRVAAWAIRGQHQARRRALGRRDDALDRPSALSAPEQTRRLVTQRFPQDDAALRPTRLGNVLAAATEYPWRVYAMDGLLWWPHLAPLLPTDPADARQAVDGAQARLAGLLNLSFVSAVVAAEAVLLLGVVGHLWTAALGAAVGGALVAWLCYQAAVHQALEVAGQLRVAFTLYRHAILTQLGVAIPDDLAAERTLWQALTWQVLGQPPAAAAPSGDGPEPAAPPAADCSPPAPTRRAGRRSPPRPAAPGRPPDPQA